MSKVAVFCSSSNKISPLFFDNMKELSQGLVERKKTILMGGENLGLMGCLAEEAISLGGEVIGILPQTFDQTETYIQGLKERIVTADLASRKKMMLEKSDAVIIFPGGLGTMDEALEVLTLKSMGDFNGPIYFVNLLDFWQPFFDFLFELKLGGMISHDLEKLYQVFENPKSLLKALEGEVQV